MKRKLILATALVCIFYVPFCFAAESPGTGKSVSALPSVSVPILGKLLKIPAGTFQQGSPNSEACRESDEGPQFAHTIGQSLLVMETEVTRQMWADLKKDQPSLGDDPSDYSTTYNGTTPVKYLKWYQAILFANLISSNQQLNRCYFRDSGFTQPVVDASTSPVYCNFSADGYRLPSEGEWEYLARATTAMPYSTVESGPWANYCSSVPFCSDLPALNARAIFSCLFTTSRSLVFRKKPVSLPDIGGQGKAASPWQSLRPQGDYTEPQPVGGSRTANDWELKDTMGNVAEFCWDIYASAYPSGPVTDYRGPTTSSNTARTARGGSYTSTPGKLRLSYRRDIEPDLESMDVGFRLVRNPSSRIFLPLLLR